MSPKRGAFEIEEAVEQTKKMTRVDLNMEANSYITKEYASR